MNSSDIPSQDLSDYFKGFDHQGVVWPTEALDDTPDVAWWRSFLTGGLHEKGWFESLITHVPQLGLPQESGISKSDHYRSAVLRGEPLAQRAVKLARPEALELYIAEHWAGSIPVIHTPHRADFEWLLRALAYRCEPLEIPNGVHAQAISGLIHWGLIRELGSKARARLILLHSSPYGSVSESWVPNQPSREEWIRASNILRLEHELTHLATKRILGEARQNLLDELIADAMGMISALGFFSADLFMRCLGIHESESVPKNSRASSYTSSLSVKEKEAPGDSMSMLSWLTQQRLDVPLRKAM
jgi:hypothetical protein